MTVEDLQKELDRLKAYVKKVEAERDKFHADNILLYGKWKEEKAKRKKVEKKNHEINRVLRAKTTSNGGAN